MTEKYLLLYRRQNEDDWNRFSFSEMLDVGSGTENQLSIEDGELSGTHFELRENPTGIYLKDVDAAAGETLLNGESLPANRPMVLGLNQVFTAGTYNFQVVLNVDEEVLKDKSTVAEVSTAVKDFGIWKAVLIGIAVVAVAVIGGLLIYTNLIKKPDGIIDIAVTQIVGEAVEVAGTLVPTELFEVSSTAIVEAVDTIVTAPGMGNFDLQEMLVDVSNMDIGDLMELSMDSGQLIEIATTITGENIGYVYTYSGLEKDGIIITTGLEFIEAEVTEEVDGVQMPDWGDGEIPVEMAWQPVLTYLEDDSNRTIALLQPVVYSAAEGEQVYHVEGIYQKEGSDVQFTAMARFSEAGELLDILTFGKVDEERQTPYKVSYQPGDTFTPYELEFVHNSEETEDMAMELVGNDLPTGWSQLLELALGESNDNSFQFGIGVFKRHQGNVLTIGETGLTWVKADSAEGKFVTGIAIEDLDGNLFVGYIPILVNP